MRRRRVMRYAECQKNHAARVGGYALDGCREFMADGEEGTSAAMLHRNFHRRVQEYESMCECAVTQNWWNEKFLLKRSEDLNDCINGSQCGLVQGVCNQCSMPFLVEEELNWEP
ncbi:uncharacterized protein A4U43_C03F430 [Asparagus officinalis]|uniref:ZF-HD dimerization-type domain-containing protein n=1 Tax=Asparagus officinalis TaxID=4686 RepID=A0A5P1FB55_ASPOF|nr:uncharacterized protein A4U43_C03F430 [Asparagus officinalis]